MTHLYLIRRWVKIQIGKTGRYGIRLRLDNWDNDWLLINIKWTSPSQEILWKFLSSLPWRLASSGSPKASLASPASPWCFRNWRVNRPRRSLETLHRCYKTFFSSSLALRINKLECSSLSSFFWASMIILGKARIHPWWSTLIIGSWPYLQILECSEKNLT